MDVYELVGRLRVLRDRLVDVRYLLRMFIEGNIDHMHDLYEVSVKVDEAVNKLDKLIQNIENQHRSKIYSM